jgi:hypothetical protein
MKSRLQNFECNLFLCCGLLPLVPGMAMAGLSRLILLLLLTLLLLFLVTRAAEWSRDLLVRLESRASNWPALESASLFRRQGQIAQSIPAAPCFDPRFQRPPPLFS